MRSDERPHVVIVGGGFGGLEAARALRGAPVRITLVDRQNHHLFQPLLYQVATAGLNPADIAAPIRGILRRQKNVLMLLAEVRRVDPAARRLVLDRTELTYDFLILACGATHSYFGHDEWAAVAPGLKTITDAAEVRHRVLWAFEAAEQEDDPARRAAWQTFAVVGGGPTGVELAGALAELARHTLRRDFRRFDPRTSRIVLLEAGPALLPAFPPDLREDARQRLERLGVEVRLGSAVSDITRDGVRVGDDWLAARTVLWAAGVAASPLGRTLGAPLDRAGRVRVNPDLTLPDHPEVVVVGDMAALEQDGKPVPGVAPAAMQMGRHAATNVRRALRGLAPLPFRYKDKGSMATIGRAAGVADLGRLRLTGYLGWLAWLFVHLIFLIGFRSRLLVLFQWVWAYVTYERGARLITVPVEALRQGEARPEPEVPEAGPVDLPAAGGIEKARTS
ncbi:MAG: NAD(P)/FAD-dependent oxidoreductase [Planctomycetes bacterium]|nr:NAD(P)/FAD-dependent oxidoreductase [Planctomycetota bacterium]